MFPLNLLDNAINEHARKVRSINCFGWMRESLPKKVKKRFGRH